ncbi:YmfQ family protein [Jeongeupia sp. USM3]|uniref:YmfQ family protein n=1 Tax=Jeongeupia sp. USM3 TaxID=1906741 RepID=UPI00089DD9FA|nr:putative phage tail protein [Jeongeupia sp. USM3]AOY00092.1 hypothetical protein BJP62_06290 [Jeongeupia sp. USM3]
MAELMSAGQAADAIDALFPPGPAWRSDGSLPQLYCQAWAEEVVRFCNRLSALLGECDPGTANELMPDWERVLGLPDECSVGAPSLEARRLAAAAKYTMTGGQSRGYFIGIAAQLGYPNATITEFHARRYGRARMGGRYGGWGWQFVWQLNLPASQVLPRKSGAPFGDRYQSWGDAQLECTINKLKPAHTRVFFSYGGV